MKAVGSVVFCCYGLPWGSACDQITWYVPALPVGEQPMTKRFASKASGQEAA